MINVRMAVLAASVVPHLVLASPDTIAKRLYSKYGEIQTTQRPLTRSDQADLVRRWTAQYANGTHPLASMESIIRTRTPMDRPSRTHFDCQRSTNGGYRCTDFSPGSGYMTLNQSAQATGGRLCMPLPPDVLGFFSDLGGNTMVRFAVDMSVMSYAEHTTLFNYSADGTNICASF